GIRDYKVTGVQTCALPIFAENVESLISEHQSIERCLVQVRMPRMSRDELEGIVNKGLQVIDMTIATDCLEEISGLSKGLPHYTRSEEHTSELQSPCNIVCR